MRRASLFCFLLILLVSSSLTGCTRWVRVDWSAGACVNPPEQYCDVRGTDSRVLDIAVYQLRSRPDPGRLAWEDLIRDGRDLQLLRGQLAGDGSDLARSRFTVQHGDKVKRHRFQRVKGTRYLLFVTNGRHGGGRSILLTRLSWLRGRQAVEVEYYDVKPADPGQALPLNDAAISEAP
jgi:hypothetical protein